MKKSQLIVGRSYAFSHGPAYGGGKVDYLCVSEQRGLRSNGKEFVTGWDILILDVRGPNPWVISGVLPGQTIFVMTSGALMHAELL